MFTLSKDNKVKFILTGSKLYELGYEQGTETDREKLEDCIEWAESYPILRNIMNREGYEVKEVGEIITLG